MKKIFFIISLLTIGVIINAQKAPHMRLEPAVFVPVNETRDNLQLGLGASLQAVYSINSKIKLGPAIQYFRFNGKKQTIQSGNIIYHKNNGDLSIFATGAVLTFICQKLEAGLDFGFFIPATGESEYRESSLSPDGGDFTILRAGKNNYDNTRGSFYAGFRSALNITKSLQLSLSYNYFNNAYAKTAVNEEIKDLSLVRFGITYEFCQ